MNLYDGYVADTPGFSSLELEMEPIEREHIMILMNMLLIVSLEDVCMIVNLIVPVKEAVDEGKISKERYEHYLTMLKRIKGKKGETI